VFADVEVFIGWLATGAASLSTFACLHPRVTAKTQIAT
jgi:hypothetical protein